MRREDNLLKFFTTHGWMIVLIGIIVYIMYFTGMIEEITQQSQFCNLGDGLECPLYEVTITESVASGKVTDQVIFFVRQKFGENETVKNLHISVEGCDKPAIFANVTSELQNGSATLCKGMKHDEWFESPLNVTYEKDNGTKHISYGYLSAIAYGNPQKGIAVSEQASTFLEKNLG